MHVAKAEGPDSVLSESAAPAIADVLPIGGGLIDPAVRDDWAGRLYDPRRLFDITVTLLLLPFALVLGAITALAVYLDSPGPVFFWSERIGRNGRPFRMLKFRKFHGEADGIPLTMQRDERFTPIGRFLAVTKLDELPQLLNVLRGDMRLVGPRPEVREFVEGYHGPYVRILEVVPGITGPAALAYADESYLLGAQRDPMAYYRAEVLPRKIEIDLAYVDDHNVRGDIAILFRTFAVPARQYLRRLRFLAAQGHPRRSPAGARLLPVMVAGALLVIAFAMASSSPV